MPIDSLNSKKEEKRDFQTRTRPGVEPGKHSRIHYTIEAPAAGNRFFLTLNVTSLSLCNTVSPKPQNES